MKKLKSPIALLPADFIIDKPFVSVVMAVKNEEKFIGRCLRSFEKQTYSVNKFEIVIASGSSDRTNEIIREFSEKGILNITLLANPSTLTADGLNIALKAARGEIICHFIGHAYPDADYIEGLLAGLKSSRMLMTAARVAPVSFSGRAVSRAIAAALASPFSVGWNAFSRKHSAVLKYSHWPLLPKFLTDEIGEVKHYLRGEDYEYFERIAAKGGRVFFNPQVKCYYYPRETLSEIFRVYYIMGKYRLIMFYDTGRCLNLRHLAPLLFILGIISSPLGGYLFPEVYLAFGILYLLLILTFSFKAANGRELKEVFLISWCFLLIHIANGLGLLYSILFEGLKRWKGKILAFAKKCNIIAFSHSSGFFA